jgi:hypothetical protein
MRSGSGSGRHCLGWLVAGFSDHFLTMDQIIMVYLACGVVERLIPRIMKVVTPRPTWLLVIIQDELRAYL